MKTIKVAEDFHHRLANRDKSQGDGTYTAIEFRERYLSQLDNEEIWKTDSVEISLDFTGIKKIGPSFANEAFAYFTKYAKPKKILSKISLINISKIQKLIIEEELDDGYRKL